jgi:hypothetical protein
MPGCRPPQIGAAGDLAKDKAKRGNGASFYSTVQRSVSSIITFCATIFEHKLAGIFSSTPT